MNKRNYSDSSKDLYKFINFQENQKKTKNKMKDNER